jgi:hypothetical protein
MFFLLFSLSTTFAKLLLVPIKAWWGMLNPSLNFIFFLKKFEKTAKLFLAPIVARLGLKNPSSNLGLK